MDKKEIFKKFLETNDVLIVDKNPSTRTRLLKIMVNLGASVASVHSTGSLAEAEDVIATKKIGIVLSDYFINGGSGFDLFKIVRDKNPTKKEMCLVLVTSNISQTAVAKAAEEDVDSFIIKPYTIQSIQENLISVVAQKIKPSDYVLKIEEGKVLIGLGKYAEAISVLKVATGLHAKPSLALFYIGQAEYLKNQIDSATGSYNQGLAFNNIHYKCLVGLYEVFIRDNRFHEAYQVVKKIAKYFPANPDRMAQIVRLAIRTGNFQDMQMFYEIFTALEERVQLLTNYIGSGLFIAGKHSLMNNNPEMALHHFNSIAVSCSEFTKFLRAIVVLLVQYNRAGDAEKFLGRFPFDAKNSDDFMVSEFLVTSRLNNDHGFIMKLGFELYNRKIRDYDCMVTFIDAMAKFGYDEAKIAPYREEMRVLYPEKMMSAG